MLTEGQKRINKMDRLLYNMAKRKFRKELRNNLTPAEATLWRLLKNKQLGKKFRRQVSIGPYIVDFYCFSEKIAVELDGQRHFTSAGNAYDKRRDAFINGHGIRVIRFENKEVFNRPEFVLETIATHFYV